MTPVDCAYAAGFFDGEGTVVIRHRKPTWQMGPVRKDGTRRPGRLTAAQFSPGVSIGQSSVPVLEWFVTHWGGHVSPHTAKSGVRPMWYWQRTSALGVQQFLLDLQPFLIVKAPMAQAMLAWLALTPEVRRFKAAEFRMRIRLLNKPGLAA